MIDLLLGTSLVSCSLYALEWLAEYLSGGSGGDDEDDPPPLPEPDVPSPTEGPAEELGDRVAPIEIISDYHKRPHDA
jgi:hypothetical protein